jgi:capsular polysaccharide transport system permease protein
MDQEVRAENQKVPTTDREVPMVDRDRRSVQGEHWLKRHIVFVVTVLVPTLVAVLYYGLIASDVYISESRFLIRSPQKPPQTGLLGDFLQGTGIARSQDDTYTVHDFILSRDALKELDDKLAIRKAYSNERVDPLKRFSGLDWDKSFEAFYRYYGKEVTVELDPQSSISILTVRAFTARDAQNINQMLLDMSERLINSLNDRSRHDLVHFAEEEVKVAADQARDASVALLEFRSKQAVFEPDKQAAIQLEGVAKLQEELVTTEAELAQLTKLSPNNPQIIGLNSRAETLRTAISSEASKVTGASGSLSVHASAFERLAVESEFADKQLGVALATLESARNEAARKQLYLDRLVQPNLPDRAMEPRRIRSVFTIFLLSLIAWGAVSLVLASVREHAD